ncbi:MAG: twin-arginine translocation signal domain-containing protein, partial [Minisyncoccia bacterium]
MNEVFENRRTVLKLAGAAGATAVVGMFFSGCEQASASGEDMMSPNEDLMQEHALLNRVQLIYDDARRRLRDDIELA